MKSTTPGGTILVPPVCPEIRMTNTEDLNFQFTNWLHDLAPWELFFTGTFSWEASNAACQRAWKRFMKKQMPDVTWFMVTEKNPQRPGYHIHALMQGTETYRRKTIWNRWYKRYGINKLEPIKSRKNVEDYTTKHCSNYLTKGVGWYDFEINDRDLWSKASGKT